MDRIDAEAFDDGEKDRRQDEQGRNCFEERAHDKQEKIDDEKTEQRTVHVRRNVLSRIMRDALSRHDPSHHR